MYIKLGTSIDCEGDSSSRGVAATSQYKYITKHTAHGGGGAQGVTSHGPSRTITRHHPAVARRCS